MHSLLGSNDAVGFKGFWTGIWGLVNSSSGNFSVTTIDWDGADGANVQHNQMIDWVMQSFHQSIDKLNQRLLHERIGRMQIFHE